MGRFLSQANTEPSASPVMELSKEKKKKKKSKKKHEEVEEIQNMDTSVLEAVGLSPKKKKKKKKKERENNELDAQTLSVVTQEMQNHFTVEEPSEENVTKVKKKKKHKIEANNDQELAAEIPSSKRPKKDITDASSESPKKQALEDETEHAPRKKKRKKNSEQASREAEVVSLEEFSEKVADDDKVEDCIWTEEEELMIVERMKEQLPEIDKKSCRRTLKLIDWESVSFNNRSAEACKNQFMSIFTKINVVKSLTTVLGEVKEFAMTLSKRRRRVVQPIHRFLKVYMDSNRKEIMKATGETYFSVAREAWKNLPKEKKAVYQAEYEEDLKKWGLEAPNHKYKKKPANEETPISLPRSPYEIWSWEESERKDKQSPSKRKRGNLRAAFSNIQKQKKMHYIMLSLEELHKFEKEAKEFKKHNPDYVYPKYHGPSKEDLRFYVEEKGMPACPPTTPSLLYFEERKGSGEFEKVPGKSILMAAISAFKNVSSSEKEMYKDAVNEKMVAFHREMTVWEKGQDEITLFAKEKFIGKRMLRLANTLASLNLQTPTKKKGKNLSEIFSNVVHFDMSCPKFHDEPVKAPNTPFKLFCMRFEHSLQRPFESRAQKNKVCKENWEKLSDKQKLAYAKRCGEVKEKYEEQLLNYVQNMSKKMRSVYLGFHRKTLFQYFHRDIFERDYPNKKYPVYALSPKKKQGAGVDSEEDFASAPAGAIDDNLEMTSEPLKNGDYAKGKKTQTSLQFNDELIKPKDRNISKSKSAKNVITKAHVSVSNLSESSDEFTDTTDKKPAIKSLRRNRAHLDSDSSEEDIKPRRIKVKKKYNISEEESSDDSDEEDGKLPSKSPWRGGMRTVQPSTLGKGKPSLTTPGKLNLDSSSDDEMDIEVCPAWQTKVHKQARKPVDESSSGLSDSD